MVTLITVCTYSSISPRLAIYSGCSMTHWVMFNFSLNERGQVISIMLGSINLSWFSIDTTLSLIHRD